ncbi:MAG TPA: hypothetical protein VJU15_07360, partial [Gemmatimonadales bacterium]|nr:hypothetical protein [Gemmatimonadales bacterium]
RVGLYAPQSGVGDLSRRVHQVLGLKASFLEDVYPRNPAISAEMRRIDTTLREAGDTEKKYLVAADSSGKPKLHLKANFFISAATWRRLAVLPEWGPVLRHYFMYLASSDGDPRNRREVHAAPPDMIRAFHALAQALSRTITREEAEGSITYFTVGSTNMNYRSMYLDGEVQITTTGWNTLPGLVDFFLLVGLTEWPETQAELDKLLPPPGGMTKSMARLLRNLL